MSTDIFDGMNFSLGSTPEYSLSEGGSGLAIGSGYSPSLFSGVSLPVNEFDFYPSPSNSAETNPIRASQVDVFDKITDFGLKIQKGVEAVAKIGIAKDQADLNTFLAKAQIQGAKLDAEAAIAKKRAENNVALQTAQAEAVANKAGDWLSGPTLWIGLAGLALTAYSVFKK